jgi:Holliday junction resolvasome RuvABC ATP-dependent DNA helicase subunit
VISRDMSLAAAPTGSGRRVSRRDDRLGQPARLAEELRFILERKWAQLGLAFSPDDFTDAEALAAIARITGGNVRLVQRLFAQIERVLEINQLRTITAEVVQVARESLVIGPLG